MTTLKERIKERMNWSDIKESFGPTFIGYLIGLEIITLVKMIQHAIAIPTLLI